MDLSEKETREKIIDHWLTGDAGWREEYIKREVNSVKSDFKIKRYDIKKGEGKEEGRFIDYVLLDEHKCSLALIESKRFLLDAEKGSIQATTLKILRMKSVTLSKSAMTGFIKQSRILSPFPENSRRRRNMVNSGHWNNPLSRISMMDTSQNTAPIKRIIHNDRTTSTSALE